MKNENPFFSIIMPVYNAEKYVEQSIKSVLNQTFTNFELIIIDDCSKDNSYSICQKFEKDKRIILKKNSNNLGVADTRNYGICLAKGFYITFLDADDYLERKLLEIAFKCLKNKKVDYLKYGVFEEYFNYKNKLEYTRFCQCTNCYYDNKKDILMESLKLERYPLFGYVCNTFYKSNIINDNNIKFNNTLAMNEDFDFNIQYINYTNNMKCISFGGYHYRKLSNKTSLSSKKQEDYFRLHIMKIDEFSKLLNKFNIIDHKITEILLVLYNRYVYSEIERNIKNNNLKTLIKEIKRSNIYKKFYEYEFNNLSLKEKTMIYLLKQKNEILLIKFVKIISYVKLNYPIIFARIK